MRQRVPFPWPPLDRMCFACLFVRSVSYDVLLFGPRILFKRPAFWVPSPLVQYVCTFNFYDTARQKGVELHLLCSIPQISITDLVHISRQRSHSHGMISIQTSASFRSSHHHCDPSLRVDGQSVFNLFLVITASESSSAVCVRDCNPFLIPFSHIKTHTLPQTANHAKTFRLRIELQNQQGNQQGNQP